MACRRNRWLTHCSWHNNPWCRKERSLVRRNVCRKRQYSKSIWPQFDNSLPPFPTRLCTYKRGCLVSVVTQWIVVSGTLLHRFPLPLVQKQLYSSLCDMNSRKIYLERWCRRVALTRVPHLPIYDNHHESAINKKIKGDFDTKTVTDTATTFVILNYSANRWFCSNWYAITDESYAVWESLWPTPSLQLPINVSWRHYQKTQFLERSSNFTANPQILHCMKTSSHESTTTSIQPQHTITEWTSPSIRCLNLLPLLYVRLCCFDQLEPEDVG